MKLWLMLFFSEKNNKRNGACVIGASVNSWLDSKHWFYDDKQTIDNEIYDKGWKDDGNNVTENIDNYNVGV